VDKLSFVVVSYLAAYAVNLYVKDNLLTKVEKKSGRASSGVWMMDFSEHLMNRMMKKISMKKTRQGRRMKTKS
jgi:hypothetical protein